MSIFSSYLKTIIKAVSGYQIRRCGIGRSSFIALAKDNIEIPFCHDEGLLLVNKSKDELVGTKGIYNCLELLRLKTILEKYQVNLVLDVGANRGQFASKLRNIGYKDKIISFEPLSSIYQVLKQRAIEDPNWETYNLALGKENGKQVIHIAEETEFSSFLNSNSWCEQRFGERSLAVKDETVTVRRLDELLSEAIENLDELRIYLKMDTQGYDLEVFGGVGNILKHIVALQSEVSVLPIYENMPHITDSISLFEKAGFDLAGMYPISYSGATLQVVEFDCLMIKSTRQHK